MPADFWTNAGVLIAAVVAMLAGYYGPRVFAKPAGEASRHDPVLTGIGMAFGDKEQQERLISGVERIAKAAETLADQKQADMSEKMDELLQRLEQAERQR